MSRHDVSRRRRKTRRTAIGGGWTTPCERFGFTVVEVLVALTVAGVGLLAVFGAMKMAHEVTGRIRNQEAAQMLAEQHMSELLTKTPAQPGTTEGTEGRFAWRGEVRASRQPSVLEVVVTVSWEQRGVPLVFELVSLRDAKKNGGG